MTAEAEFWNSREALTKIHQQARARRVAPWAVFGGVIARVVASAEPRVQLPAIVGGPGSLNTYIGIVGRSGQGKGASQAAAAALLDAKYGCLFDIVSVGSGEGIAAAYVDRRKDDAGEFSVHQHSESALLDVAEIDTLAALSGRQGSTLLSELRKVWSGERLGFQNRDSSRSLPVEAHQYRAALVAGIQPTRAATLLDDHAGGTPQRFLWLPATDPDAPAKAPQPPAAITWIMPGEELLPTIDGRRTIRVCDTAWDAIDSAHLARLRGAGDALDGHSLFTRLKIAAALALLDERGDVAPEDWELSGVVMAVSDRTRDECRRQINAASRAMNTFRAEARAEASVVTADHAEIVAVKRCQERILEQLGSDWAGAGEIRSKITSRLREHFDDAVNELVAREVMEVAVDTYRGQERTRFRLPGPEALTKPSPLPVTPQDPHQHADLSIDSEALTEPSTLTNERQVIPSETREEES